MLPPAVVLLPLLRLKRACTDACKVAPCVEQERAEEGDAGGEATIEMVPEGGGGGGLGGGGDGGGGGGGEGGGGRGEGGTGGLGGGGGGETGGGGGGSGEGGGDWQEGIAP